MERALRATGEWSGSVADAYMTQPLSTRSLPATTETLHSAAVGVSVHSILIDLVGGQEAPLGSLAAPCADANAVVLPGGETAMHLAAKKGHTDVIQMLLNQGANPLSLNNFSKSPLSEAQERAYDQVVEMLSSATLEEKEG